MKRFSSKTVPPFEPERFRDFEAEASAAALAYRRPPEEARRYRGRVAAWPWHEEAGLLSRVLAARTPHMLVRRLLVYFALKGLESPPGMGAPAGAAERRFHDAYGKLRKTLLDPSSPLHVRKLTRAYGVCDKTVLVLRVAGEFLRLAEEFAAALLTARGHGLAARLAQRRTFLPKLEAYAGFWFSED